MIIYNVGNSAGDLVKGSATEAPPAQNASHHQDDITCLIGNPNLNLHLPLLRGRGTHPKYIPQYLVGGFFPPIC